MKGIDLFSPPSTCCFCEAAVKVPWGRGWRRVCDHCRARLKPIRDCCCLRCGRFMKRSFSSPCSDCQQWGQTSLEANRSVCTYNRFARELVWMLKYRGNEEWAKPLGEMMAERLLETGWKAAGVTYVPVHADRLHERGFNQAERLAQVVAKAIGLPKRSLLQRIHQADSQSQKGRGQRLAAIKGAFRLSASVDERTLSGSWILVDDVYTTGATLVECARTLADAGVERIRSLTFAR